VIAARLLLVLGLAPTVWAGPGDEVANRLSRDLMFGSARMTIRHMGELDLGSVTRRPELTLALCAFAADAAFGIDVGREATQADELADKLDALAQKAVDRHPQDAAALWARLEAEVFRLRLRDATPPDELTAKAREIARVTEGTPRAAAGLLRGVELILEAARQPAGGRAAALEALRSLAAKAGPGDVAAAARAALLLAEANDAFAADDKAATLAKIDEGLTLLAPHRKAAPPNLHVVRRHNDLVTLARTAGIKPKAQADYHLMPFEDETGIGFKVPLSRRWRVQTVKKDGWPRVRVSRLRPAGTKVFRVWFGSYMDKVHYPIGEEKGALGRKIDKLAKAYMEWDLRRIEPREKRGPRSVKLSRRVPSAKAYEVTGTDRGGFRRFRTWFFRRRGHSYSVRIDEIADLGPKLSPEVTAFLETVEVR
jgi:hypothetical protein